MDDWERHMTPLLHDMTGDEQHEDFFSHQDLVVSGIGGGGSNANGPVPSGSPSGASSNQGGTLSPQAAPLSPGGASHTSTPACCESGRPVIADPVSGQTVCSCQYDSARLALSSYPRLTAGTVGVYGTPYPSTEQNPYPSIGVDSSAFYSPLNNPYSLKEGGSGTDMPSWTSAGLQPSTPYYPYDPTLAAYGYGAGYDLAARRKNATRESTATLKAWLNEHKKNPYPTKGEKIMLAIITKMTLTQVSTWFANARRRLKKENKMTWEPKNKTDDDDDAMLSDDDKDKDDHDDKIKHKDDDIKSDEYSQGMHHPMLGYGIKDESKRVPGDCGVPIPATKPKIWSLADTAACKTPPPTAQPWPSSASCHIGHQNIERVPTSESTMNGFALPSAAVSPSVYARYGGFPGNHYGGSSSSNVPNSAAHPCGFSDVQTDTPPQTPPNMKLPSVAGSLTSGAGQAASLYGYPRQSPIRDSYQHQNQQHHQTPQNHQHPHQNSDAAFKPFYKR